jgi:hypothetical protein
METQRFGDRRYERWIEGRMVQRLAPGEIVVAGAEAGS